MLPRFGGILAGSIALALTAVPLRAEVTLTESANFSIDVSKTDGRITMDLLGSIWVLPADGGPAKQLTDGLVPAAGPRWSPDGASILYEARAAGGSEIWQVDDSTLITRRISSHGHHEQNPSWHPQGERIVFSAERYDSGLDIWETDLPTGLSWRITDHPGDETEPAWSLNGQHLAYIRKIDDHYLLVLRRRGEAEQNLVVSDTPLSAPSWRPDGSLLTFLRHAEGKPSLEMVILSDPPLTRVITADENYYSSPVSWRGRNQLVYAADGQIKTRDLDDRRSRSLPFRTVVQEDEAPTPGTVPRHEVVVGNPPTGRLVIRAARIFDGIGKGYRERRDVLIDEGRIAAVAPRQNWEDATVLDLGNVTVLPGLIDAWSGPLNTLRDGPAMLAYGVTTMVSQTDDVTLRNAVWEDEVTPGPRVLPAAVVTATTDASDSAGYYLVQVTPAAADIAASRNAVQSWRELGIPTVVSNWMTGRRIGADILLGAAALPSTSLHGQHHQLPATQQKSSLVPPAVLSGLADAATPGISTLLESRQANAFGHESRPGRRIAGAPQLAAIPALVVAGSEPNGLTPGLALHAELRALRAAGLSGERVLWSAGRNAATLLGLDNQIGTIAPGAMADLVLVRGDPLDNVDDLLNIVAIVRNGRFFSLVSLLERADHPPIVE